MSTYGLRAYNTSNQVLISSDLENLHFGGTATLTGNDGGNYGDFPGYSGSHDTDLDGRVIYTYTFTTAGTPLVFIRPTDYTQWHGIVTHEQAGTTWTFKVMKSGLSTTNAPTLFCFVSPQNLTVPAGQNYGMKVMLSGGGAAFDSRLRPLAIVGGGVAQPPSCPVNDGCPTTTSGHSWNYATLDWDFGSSNRYNSYGNTGTHTDLMFAAPSLAQAVYKRQMHGHKASCNWECPWPFSGCCGGHQDHYSTAAWWAMYRSTFRLRTNYFDAGWTNFAAGYSFSSNHESGGWFGGGGGSFSTGTMPYTAKTINLTGNAYIIADATRYV